jgi:hypothetical protein
VSDSPVTPDIPTLDIKTQLTSKAKELKRVPGFRTSEKMLPYDSTKVYTQMGTAVQASAAANSAMRRIAIVLDDVQVSRDSQTGALVEKLNDHVKRVDGRDLQLLFQRLKEVNSAVEAAKKQLEKCNGVSQDWSEYELLLQKFTSVKSAELVPLISKAFGDMKSAMVWYQKMLESHRVEDQVELLPVLEELKKIVAKLGKAREDKIHAAVAMEERFSKSRRAYWAEKRSNANLLKKSNRTRPVVHENMPYPVNSVTPVVSLDPKQLLEQAGEQIRTKEKLKKTALKQQEIDEKESN